LLPSTEIRAGFRVQDSIQVIVYEQFKQIDHSTLISNLPDVHVLPVTEQLMSALITYDESVVGHGREQLLRLCLFEPESFAVAAICDKTSQVLGYGHVRLDNAEKLMCGPLYALTEPIAEMIMKQLLVQAPFAYQGLTLMVPDCVPNGSLIAEKLQLPALYLLPRLFTKHLPVAQFDQIYGIHSPNFYPF
jgi:hypothetical protein